MIAQKDYADVRKVLRWAAIGAMVSPQKINDAVRVAVDLLPKESAKADSVRFAL